MLLENKVAVVTGGAQGIGFAIAKRFLREKAKVIIADIDTKAGKAAVAKLSKIGSVRFVHCDVSARLDVHNLIAEAVDELGGIDILVNNASVVSEGNFLDLKEDEFDRVMSVNLKGTFLCSQAAAKHMVKQVEDGGEAGCIVNISSVNAIYALPEQVPYSISKGGVNQLTKIAAQSLAEHGIRVNGIGPGSVSSQMLESILSKDPVAKEKLLDHTPMGRTGDPEEIAAIATFLASSEASYITGQTIYADGGRLGMDYTLPAED